MRITIDTFIKRNLMINTELYKSTLKIYLSDY